MSTPTSPYDPAKHPRGHAGRWTGGPGRSSNAHAMRGPVRPPPSPFKRDHAVSPTIPTRPRGIRIVGGTTQGGD
jgi:hypothetical protein